MFSKVTALSKAPTLFILFGICSAILFYDLGISPFISSIAGVTVALGIIFLSYRTTVKGFWTFTFLIVVLSFVISYFSLFRIAHHTVDRSLVEAEGKVLYERSWGGKRTIIVSLAGSKYMARISPKLGVREGDVLLVKGYILPFADSPRGSGEFREDLFWKAKGVKAEVIPGELKIHSSSTPDIHRWRSSLRHRILLSVPEKTRGYLLASWLGVKDPDLVTSHSASGTVHLLAVSGFHVAILASALFFLFRYVAYREVLISLCIWGYVALTGFSPSAFRAAFMLQLVLVSRLFGKPVSPVNSVSVAGVVMLLLNPFCFWDLGWRLSMIAAMAISAFFEIDLPEKIRLMLVSPMVWLSTAGLTVSVFGRVPLAGIFLNLFAIPFFGFMLPLAGVLFLIASVGFPFAEYLYLLSEIPFLAWERMADIFCCLLPYGLGGTPLVIIFSILAFFAVLFRGIGYTFYRAVLVSGMVTSLMTFISDYIVV